MTVLLAIALFGPAVMLPVARFAATSSAARRWSSTGALALAALWLVILVADDGASIGRFGAGAAPVAIGTWLLVAALTWPTRRSAIALAVLVAGVAVGGMALLAGGGDRSDAAGALALAVAIAVLGARVEDDGGAVPAAAAVFGAAALALGLARGGLVVPALGLAAIVVGAGARPRRIGSLLLPAALALGVSMASGDRLAVGLSILGCALASRPGASLGLWAIAAAAAGAPAAGLLLGAAAVLVTVALNPMVALVALPGAAALTAALADHGSRSGVVLAALAALTVVRLWRAPEDLVPGTPSRSTIAALGLAAWLVLAPETWTWTGRADLASWGRGVVVALVASVGGLFVAASYADASFVLGDVEVADPAYAVGDPRWARRLALGAVVILGLCGAALVSSTVS